jgi:hypothetical protein
MSKTKDQAIAPLPKADDVLARLLAMPPDPKKATSKKPAKKPRK